MNYLDSSASAVSAQVISKLRAAGCVYAEEEARLLMNTARTPGELAELTDRRAAGFPLEPLIGWVEFCGLRIEVDPEVFVPRRRTEFLARQAVALAEPGDIVVDMCCGTGALGAVFIAEVGRIEVHAVDIDPAAVRCARRNLRSRNGFVYEGDLFEPLPDRLRGRIRILAANAPYVPTEDVKFLPREARIHEARRALDGGADGLDVQRRIAATAPLWLANDGCLLIETSERQAPMTLELFAQYGLCPRMIRSEELDATVIIGTLT
ncbi:putative protein N(5)-glutamine methyltransferase [Paenibacillus mucilaginosus]|uniref:putative protein N(5)-glutamine methyltransferase n=1 Tax=Paenibacillus mucilaginosus TaxID=61624 RepID=UPI003D1CD8C6